MELRIFLYKYRGGEQIKVQSIVRSRPLLYLTRSLLQAVLLKHIFQITDEAYPFQSANMFSLLTTREDPGLLFLNLTILLGDNVVK